MHIKMGRPVHKAWSAVWPKLALSVVVEVAKREILHSFQLYLHLDVLIAVVQPKYPAISAYSRAKLESMKKS